MTKYLPTKNILLKVLPLVVLILLAKYAVHMFGFELLELNALFTSFIAANVFLLGFLMSGVLTDYKESEKLPGELAVSLESIADEADQLYQSKKLPTALACVNHIEGLTQCIVRWFYRKERTREVFARLYEINVYLTSFESHTQANYIVRLKQEQTNLRRLITRIDSIRDTSFIGSGYLIAEVNSVLLLLGLVFLTIDPFLTSMFLTGAIALLFIYLLFLIKDIDDPFGFGKVGSVENVSLRALEGLETKLQTYANINPKNLTTDNKVNDEVVITI